MTPLPLPLALADELYRHGSTKTPRTVADELVRMRQEIEATDRQVEILTDTLSECSKAYGGLQAENEALKQALAPGKPVAVPEGWHIAKADNGQVLVSAPNCDPGSAWIKNQGPLPQRILYALVGAMLDAPQPQPDDNALCANEGVHELSGLLNTEADRLEHLLAPQPRREWVGLTEHEAAECWSSSTVRTWQAIEAKLREKNAPESKVN